MQNKFSPTSRNYTKANFIDLIESYIPDVYLNEDLDLSGQGVNPVSEIINTHVQIANNISTVLSISGVEGTQTSSINNISGISQYFVKQNDLTDISPFKLESKLLVPLGASLSRYDTSAEFETYVSSTLLPLIIPEQGTKPGTIVDNAATLSVLTDSAEPSSIHNYLIDTLGWFYFLNTSADGGLDYSPSSYVLSSFIDVYNGKTLQTIDGVKGLTEYVWKNLETCSFGGYIPASFTSGAADAITEASAGNLPLYTSGTLKLDALKTMLDVIYSPAYMDNEDYRVKDALDSYINASTDLNDRVSLGPLRKYLNALGFSFADLSDSVENIKLIYDIENVPEQYLQYIAQTIGWKLFGNSPDKWRHQLRSAVEIYKRKGTLESIQYAINALIVNTSLDVSGQVKELHESYLPQIIWYALGTESRHFLNLNTWTQDKAITAGVGGYNVSSLEENLKIAVDSILLDLYEAHPENFFYEKNPYPVYTLHTLDENGDLEDIYTTLYHHRTLPFYMVPIDDPYFEVLSSTSFKYGDGPQIAAATFEGPLGYGMYAAGDHDSSIPLTGVYRPEAYLSGTGNLNFVFNYRDKHNYPLPPFEEVKYYEDCQISHPLVDTLSDRLKCFGVDEGFVTDVSSFLLNSAVNTSTNLTSLNGFLMLFSGVQNPPNYDRVLNNITSFYQNLIPLWNGKSSHLHVEFAADDFDFSKTTIEGDSRYAVYEASRVINEFIPAHAVPKVSVAASATDEFEVSSTRFHYLGFDKDDTRESYASATILSNFEFSGAQMTTGKGNNDGRGGLNTFKRDAANTLTSGSDNVIDDSNAITSAARRALRRRDLRQALPKAGYYDRTGFNGPVSYDPSTLENSFASSLGELTLGYVASAGKFHVVDHLNPSGVWDSCETLTSPGTFSGVDTSNTFPYRGLNILGSNAKMPEIAETTARYVDRGQLPGIHRVMHQLFEQKAYDHANRYNNLVSHLDWKDEVQSYANAAIASGLVLNSYDDYVRFAFGKGLHKLHRDYCEYFNRHGLSLKKLDETGANIFAHVFGKGLFNCDLALEGSAATTTAGTYIGSSIDTGLPLNYNNGSGVFSVCAVAAYSDGSQDLPASGTFIASDSGEFVVNASAGKGAEFRNPHILSGIEFVNTSGSNNNSFTVYKLTSGVTPFLDNNTVIKCKTRSGMPRIRFDLSAYGINRNYLIPNHDYKLRLKVIVADDDRDLVGGGKVGVWLHTNVVDNSLNRKYYWSWVDGRWTLREEESLTSDKVTAQSNIFNIPLRDIETSERTYCLLNSIQSEEFKTDINIKNLKEDYLETLELDFDTRNFSKINNAEYLKYEVGEEFFKNRSEIHSEDTSYYVEIFFPKTSKETSYLLIDSVELVDVTLRENAGLPTGEGLQTSGWPLRKFVKEDVLYLDKLQLREVLKFYNGLAGLDSVYKNKTNSRDASITADTLEVSGGSRLNYRIYPDWVPHTKQSGHGNYESIEVEN